jgi:CTP-dependent riboflavin kinase
MRFQGTVTSGEGWHSDNMRHWKVLPFAPFPGTLNLRVGHETVDRLRARPGRSVMFRHVEFFWWTCRVRNVTCVVTWNVGCEPGVVELVAPVRLRDLPLEDGDVVEVWCGLSA